MSTLREELEEWEWSSERHGALARRSMPRTVL
jgi:hypothetical protein